jgi:hypothetical protein
MDQRRRALYQSLLGSSATVEDAIADASRRIAEIGRRNTTVVRHVVRRHGVSTMKLYDLKDREPQAHG